ncbi:MAG: PrsW family intramembrane metalloprotease [Methanoregula sp.]|nr:PrsW family intramembrane metalloprotease [Methanoregula sp.]
MKTPALRALSLRSWLSLVFAGIVLCALWLVGITPVAVVWAVFWPALILVLLIAVSAPWRAIPLLKIRIMMIAGMTVVPLLAVILVGLYTFLSKIIPGTGTGTIVHDIFSSFLIEALLVVPVIVLLFVVNRGAWITYTGPLDAALLGAGCGAGFECIENLIVRYVPWENTPEWYTGSAGTLWIGHGAVTAFAGLMLGYGLVVRNRTRFWWALPALGLLWAGAEHYWTINRAGSDNILLSLVSGGWLFLLVFTGAFILSLYLSGRTLQWFLDRDTSAKTEENFSTILFSSRNTPEGRYGKIAAYEKFRRVRQVSAWGFRHCDQGIVKKDTESFLQLLFLHTYLKMLREELQRT